MLNDDSAKASNGRAAARPTRLYINGDGRDGPVRLAITVVVRGETLHLLFDEHGLGGDPRAVDRVRRQAEAEHTCIDEVGHDRLLDLCHHAFGHPMALYVDDVPPVDEEHAGAAAPTVLDMSPEERALSRARLRVKRRRADLEEAERLEAAGPVDDAAREQVGAVHAGLMSALGHPEGRLHIGRRHRAEKAARAEHDLLDEYGYATFTAFALAHEQPPAGVEEARLALAEAEGQLARLEQALAVSAAETDEGTAASATG